MPMDTPALADLRDGFADPPRHAQQVFRSAMQALARPGTVHGVDVPLMPPEGLAPAAAALMLTLLDPATRIWLPDGPASAAVTGWLRFHTGAAPTADAAQADFAWLPEPMRMPALDAFALGSDAFPDRSTTLLLQVGALDAVDDGAPAGGSAAGRLRLRGPGIPGVRRLRAAGLPADFAAQWQAMRRLFPRGLDAYLCCGTRMAALPRSTDVEVG